MPQMKLDRSFNEPLAMDANGLALFEEHQRQVWCDNDRMFAVLLFVEWIVSIGTALWISPKAWEGKMSHVHPHVWAAILLGGLITAVPIALAVLRPGMTLTRHCIAIGQMCFSALLIHLSGGRIEAHFHIFGSLAFLAFYRDWRVLTTATLVVAADHLLRGAFWPQSVFGTFTREPWRWAEHAGWVAFEDVFLVISCLAGVREMKTIAHRQVEREKLFVQKELSRRAGMAEVATSVLHNVGNVLNSVNISASLVVDQVRQSKVPNLAKAVGMLNEHEHDLSEFVTTHEKGRQIPAYLGKLATFLGQEQTAMLSELNDLVKNIDHIKGVVAMQQSYASVSGMIEEVGLVELLEDALRVNLTSIERHKIQVVREFAGIPPVSVDKHKVLQILVNLVSNAMHATKANDVGYADGCNAASLERLAKRLILRIQLISRNDANEQVARLQVIDNGSGILPENLTRIFQHGFTTRSDGHGFGLHYCANAAKEMGGSLTVYSEGTGKGATFTLELPVKRAGVAV